MRLLTVLAVLALGTGSALPAKAQDLTFPVDKDFSEGEFAFKSELGVAYEFTWDVLTYKGNLVVCGAGKFLDPTTQSFARSLLRKATVSLDGKTILSDLSFFAKIRKGDDLRKALANCRITKAPIPKGDGHKLVLKAGGGVFRY